MAMIDNMQQISNGTFVSKEKIESITIYESYEYDGQTMVRIKMVSGSIYTIHLYEAIEYGVINE